LNKDTFSSLITHPERISAPDIAALDVFAEQFPYCQLAHFFAAKPHYDLLTVQAEEKVQRAAVYAISRYKLKKLLEIAGQHVSMSNSATVSPQDLPENSSIHQQTQEIEAHPSPIDPIDDLLAQAEISAMPLTQHEKQPDQPVSLEQATDIAQGDIDSFNEKIKKIKQSEIIENFIKTEPRISSLSTLSKDAPNKDLSEKSIQAPHGLISENLANIMIKQGKTDKAIEIYEKLVLKFPEKKSYFAEKIENLKNK
jgi:tetratricopeptide (TPR) repeat protein